MSTLAIVGVIILVIFLFNVAPDIIPYILLFLIVGYAAFCLYRYDVGLPAVDPGVFLESIWNSIISIFNSELGEMKNVAN